MQADAVFLGEPSVATLAGRILATGPREAISALAGPETRVADLGSARIFPGLRDSHAHLVPTGLARLRLDVRGLTLAQVRAAVAARARSVPRGQWILGRGFSLAALGAAREPAAADLDDVAPDHPVRIASHDLHALWLNRRALLAAGRAPDAPAYLVEDEVRRFLDAAGREGPEERVAAAREAQSLFHSLGITAVQDHGFLADLRATLRLAGEGGLRMRVAFSVRDHELAAYLETSHALPTFPGLVNVNGQKMFLDGAMTSRTAWTLEPYEGGGDTGHRAHSRSEALDRVRFAAERGYPTFFHAIGDAAVREALDLAALCPGPHHRVEHAQLIHEDDLPRFAAQGVLASMQTCHLLSDTPGLKRLWGLRRAGRAFPVRSLLASGARVRLGSDTPVEDPDPMPGVFAAAARRTLAGDPLPGDEAIPAGTALSLYFSFPALAPGAPADLVAYARDPGDVPIEDLPALRPVLTAFAGEVVWGGAEHA